MAAGPRRSPGGRSSPLDDGSRWPLDDSPETRVLVERTISASGSIPEEPTDDVETLRLDLADIEAELDEAVARDTIERFRAWLSSEGLWDQDRVAAETVNIEKRIY